MKNGYGYYNLNNIYQVMNFFESRKNRRTCHKKIESTNSDEKTLNQMSKIPLGLAIIVLWSRRKKILKEKKIYSLYRTRGLE